MRLGFKNLEVHCIVGILEQERLNEQPLEADLEVDVDIQAIRDSADVSQTVDYSALARDFSDFAREGRYMLLESLALDFTRLVRDRYPRVKGGCLELRKPGALAQADCAFVRLEW